MATKRNTKEKGVNLNMRPRNYTAVIKVVGVGGGGTNAVNRMIKMGIKGVDFVAANTDAQSLLGSKADLKLDLGRKTTRGLGAGANPEVGRQAAIDSRELIEEALKGSDMVFITAGMGGGTGTGAAPEVAKIAREMGILSVAVVTRPFPFEGKKRNSYASQGIDELAKHVDSLITIPNEKLLKVLGKGTPLLKAFEAANDVLLGSVRGIAELITTEGLVNVDFADVKTVMSEMGTAMMGTGTASGEDRAEEAASQAIACPLLEDIDLSGASGILVNITAGPDFAIDEFETVGNAVRAFASENATVVVGTVIDMEMESEIRVTVVATGIGQEKPEISLVAPDASVRTSAVSTTASIPAGNGQTATKLETEDEDLEYLDIPAFLRKQAD